MKWLESLFVAGQHVMPHHTVSRLVGSIADSRIPQVKDAAIRWFIERYNVDMSEALHADPAAYDTFNEFFTRPLKPGVRDLSPRPGHLISPVDGAVSQCGRIEHGRLFQAKGHSFSLIELLGNQLDDAKHFIGGQFATIYLSPRDYHRIHMPLTGSLRRMIYVPGRLFSVNPATTQRVPGLFARNERVICEFETEIGPFALILVGAMIVASIETVWAGRVAPRSGGVDVQDYAPNALTLKQGEEMGRFCLGSTVIMLAPPETLAWEESFAPDATVRLGQNIARIQARSKGKANT
ncbi:archaetidylserine decarboxylase [Hahella sp. SMD15-11]|uniref:Phosphatidylserine decarboxylase proenzyme n=1 Tax=Thermohahella caldifontis TaxID=3142973 RepID=A0AB39V0Y3_9GAMM